MEFIVLFLKSVYLNHPTPINKEEANNIKKSGVAG
jgi:hypothetical protein